MKKEPLSIMIVKTLLAVVIFTGIGTIIIGGAWLIGKQGKISKLVKTIQRPVENEITITTDKIEYQQNEEAELIIQNNLEESLFIAKNSCNNTWNLNPILQKYEQDKWINYKWYSYYPFSHTCESFFVCNEIEDIKKIKLLLKKDLDTPLKEGKYRIGLTFGKSCKSQERNSDYGIFGLSDEFIVYSNEFEIKKTTTINNFNWQTYRNEEFGFEMKYPKKYKIYNYADKIINRSSTVKKHNNPIANFTKEGQQDITACIEYWETREEYLDFHGSEPDFIIEANRSGYIAIDYSPGINYPVSPELKEEWEIILSTFKFIEKPDIANWQTYCNEEFEFQYPKGWKTNKIDGVNNGEIDNFRYCDGPECSYFKWPKVEITQNNSDDKTFPMTKKDPLEYELLCPEKQIITRDDGLKIETCDFRVYQGEISDFSIKPFCIQNTTRKSCIFLFTRSQLNEMTDYKWDQFSPYVGFDINKQLEEEYKDISNQIISTFKFTEN